MCQICNKNRCWFNNFVGKYRNTCTDINCKKIYQKNIGIKAGTGRIQTQEEKEKRKKSRAWWKPSSKTKEKLFIVLNITFRN